MTDKHRFEWGYVEHPGIWACGGGLQDLPPVLVGITFQVPQKEPEYAWWCYLGPRPEFENEFNPDDKDQRYFDQCNAVPQRITKNMANRFVQPEELLQVGETAMVVDCPDCGGGDSTCLYCDGEGTVIE